jgi:membrane-associated phospholipid phosphatase
MTKMKVFALLALAAGSWILYIPLNRPTGCLHSVRTPLDAHVPFVPCFVVPYLLYFPFLWGAILWRAASKCQFGRTVLAFLLINLTSAFCYHIYQTYVVREPLPEYAGCCVNLVRLVYGHDQPYNGFPSSHASGAIFAAIILWKYKHPLRTCGAVLTFLILASTVLIRQHYLIDVLGGTLLAWLSVALADLIGRRLPQRVRDATLI